MRSKISFIVTAIATLFYLMSILHGCGGFQNIQLPPENKPFQKLSEYQLFEGNLAELNPRHGLLPMI